MLYPNVRTVSPSLFGALDLFDWRSARHVRMAPRATFIPSTGSLCEKRLGNSSTGTLGNLSWNVTKLTKWEWLDLIKPKPKSLRPFFP
jgi:hypothetical protein